MQAVAGEQMPAVGGHGVVAAGLGHVEVRAIEDDARLVVAGAGQGVEQRGAGGFIQADGRAVNCGAAGKSATGGPVMTCSTGWLPMR